MFNIAVISFRETLEMVLIIIPLLAFITRLGRKDLSKYIYIGSISGLVVSIVSGLFLFITARGLTGFSQNIFEALMSFLLCGLIIYSVAWVSKQNNNFNSSIEAKYNIQITGVGLFLLSALTIFREFLELILFTLPLAFLNPLNIVLGVFIGISITALLTFIIYKTSVKININIVFSFIALFLIFIGSEMFGEGLVALLPQYGPSIERSGQMVFGIPMLFIFIKNQIKKYTKKQS